MGASGLSDALVARLTEARADAWTRSFVLRTVTPAYTDPDDVFSSASEVPVDLTLYGDWLTSARAIGTSGGMAAGAMVALNTSIFNEEALAAAGARMVLDGGEYSIDRIIRCPDTGEVVVHGTKVM